MRYRIIRYLKYDDNGCHAVFECQRQKFFFIPLGKWHLLKDNDREHKLMVFRSLRKAKEALEKYFLRDIGSEHSKHPSSSSEFINSKRYCHYIDADFMEFKIKNFFND